jgi:hypothetical protein
MMIIVYIIKNDFFNYLNKHKQMWLFERGKLKLILTTKNEFGDQFLELLSLNSSPVKLITNTVGYEFLQKSELKFKIMSIVGKYRDAVENPNSYLGLIKIHDEFCKLKNQNKSLN